MTLNTHTSSVYIGPDSYGQALHEGDLVVYRQRIWTIYQDRIVNLTGDSVFLLIEVGTLNLERA